jgi:hypothetical protein
MLRTGSLEIFLRRRYICSAMSTTVRNGIRREVLRYLQSCDEPVSISSMAGELQNRPGLKSLRDSDLRAVVQPMIVTGTLSYAPGLKIKLGDANR